MSVYSFRKRTLHASSGSLGNITSENSLVKMVNHVIISIGVEMRQ